MPKRSKNASEKTCGHIWAGLYGWIVGGTARSIRAAEEQFGRKWLCVCVYW